MARSKRKRSSAGPDLLKKHQKRTSAAKDAYDPGELWEIKNIIDENSRKYLIDWKDNPVTGESYTPTWEPKAHANREAIIDWERKKRKKQQKQESDVESGPGQTLEPKFKPGARAAVAQQTSNADQTARQTTGHQTINRRTPKAAASLGDLTYIPSQEQDSQETQLTHLSTELEIQDSLEQNEGIYSSQFQPFIVIVSPRGDIDKSEYLEYPESNEPARDVDFSAPRLESAAPKSPSRLLFGSIKPRPRTAVSFGVGSKTVIPDSQPIPSSLTRITTSTCDSIPGRSQSSRGGSHPQCALSQSSAKLGANQNSPSIVNTINNLSGFATATGSHTSGEAIKTVQDSSIQEATENSVRKANSTDQAASWLTASYPILTAPVPSPPEGSSRPNCSIPPDQPSSQASSSVPSPSNLSHLTSPNPTSGLQEKALVSQKITGVLDHASTQGQSITGDNSVSDTSAAFQTQLPVAYSAGTTNDPITENNSFDTSVIQQAAQVDPLARFRPVSNFISSQEQARGSPESITSGTTALHRAVEATLPAEAELEPSWVDTRLSSLKSNCEPGILQSLEVDSVADPPHWEHQQSRISSIPSPPSFSPAQRGVSVSLGSKAASEAQMSESPGSPTDQSAGSLRERLRNMRASFATSRMSPSRSPSVIPPHPPASASESINKPGSGPVQGLIARQPVNRTGLQHPVMPAGLSQGGGTIVIGKPLLGQSEFIVALPMTEEIRSQYQQAIYNNKENIELFTRSEQPDQSMRKKMTELTDMIKHVENLSIHADLAKSMSPEPMKVSRDTEARWAQFCSAKFNFLGHLLTAMGRWPSHVAILAEAGPLLDLLEKFLRAMKIKFHRPDNRAQSPLNLETTSHVTLLPTGRKGANFIVSRATAVIVMDASFNPKDDHVQSFRRHLTIPGRLAPAIHLIIANSAEHVDRCLPKKIDPTLRLKLLVSCMTQARNDVGKLPAGYPSPAEAAEAVARFLLKTVDRATFDDLGDDKPDDDEMDDGTPPEWPLPLLGEVAGVSELMESQTSSGSVGSTQTDEGSIRVKSEESQSQKRSLDTVEDIESSKKQRLTPAPAETIQPVNMEVTNEAASIEPAVPVTTENSEAEAITQLHAKLEEQKQVEAELRQTVSRMEELLREYGKAINEAREEVEQQVRDSRAMRKERDAAVAAVTQSEERRKAQSEEISKLKEDRTRLENEVREARETLLRSDVPEKAAWARLQEERQRAQEEMARLQKRLEMTQQDFDFTRVQYQAASTAAVEARSEVETLRKSNEELAREAGVERVKLQQLLAKREEDEEGKKGEIGRLRRKLEEQEQILRGFMGVVESGGPKQGAEDGE